MASPVDEGLAQLYEILQRHEKTLHRLTVQTEALIAALKHRDADFAALFDECERASRDALVPAQALQSRLFAETIARLRGI